MPQALPLHPVARLMEARGWAVKDLVEKLAARGRLTSVAYMRHLFRRRKRPSFGFADDLSLLFDREVSADAIMKWGSREDGSTVAPRPRPARASAP